MVTQAERFDAIYPRIGKALQWGAERYNIPDYYADTEETKAAEMLLNVRLLAYANGEDERDVKTALERFIRAHAKRASDKSA